MSAKDIQKMFSPVIHHEGGAYWAEIPAMPGCFTVADTLDELGPNLMEAMTCWLLASADAKRAASPRRSRTAPREKALA